MKFLTWWEFTKISVSTLWDMRPVIFTKDFWIMEFPDYYHPKCFDCNLGIEDCPECKYFTFKKGDKIC